MDMMQCYFLNGTDRAFFIKTADKPFTFYNAVFNPNNASRPVQRQQKKTEKRKKEQKSH